MKRFQYKDYVVYAITDDLVFQNITETRKILTEHLANRGGKTALDLSRCERVDSAGLDLLFACYRSLREGSSMVLVGANRSVIDLLQMAHLIPLVRRVDKLDDLE